MLKGVKEWSSQPHRLLEQLRLRSHAEIEVEVGRVFTEANREMMSIESFLKKLENGDPNVYLAQTSSLFFRVPELLQDLFNDAPLPWLNVSRCDLPNAWIGPPGKLTPIHRDPKANLLMQVIGKKLVILFPSTWPEKALYLFDSTDVRQNSSRIGNHFPPTSDEEQAALADKFPWFVQMLEEDPPMICELSPGDVLSIPARMYHVRGVDFVCVGVWE